MSELKRIEKEMARITRLVSFKRWLRYKTLGTLDKLAARREQLLRAQAS